jgi:hypothetical protein
MKRMTNLELYGGTCFYTKLEEYEDYLYTLNKEELINECVNLGIDAEDTGELNGEKQWINYIRKSVAIVRDLNAIQTSNYEDRYMRIMDKQKPIRRVKST